MDFDPTPNNQTEPSKVRPEKEENEALELVRKYGPMAALALAAVLVVVLVVIFQRYRAETEVNTASERFLNAQSAEQFQAIVDDHPDTPTAPMALLALAAERYREGRFDMAETHYRQFMERYPNHMMQPAAELGLAYCEEGAGRLDNALSAFRSFAERYPNHYLMAQARLSEARILALQAQYDDARAIYEQFLDEPDSPWRAQARTDLLYMEKKIRAANQQ